jgi:hypothetical protein
VQIVEKGSPDWIVAEDGVSKADKVTICLGADGELILTGRSKAG